MNRRSFMKIGGAAVVATGLSGVSSASSISLTSQSATVDSQPEKGKLHVRFLGTGAADWNGPDERGEHRRLTSILLENSVLIDFTPSDEDMLPQGCSPKTILYTHSHPDHYNPAAALKLGISKVYVSESWIGRCRNDFAKASRDTGIPSPDIRPLAIGQQANVSGLVFTALPASHSTSDLEEDTLIYLVEKGHVRLLYATDTGGIVSRAARIAGIDVHEKPGKPITALIMEATMGMEHDSDFRIFAHSSVGTVSRTVKVLEDTKRYLPAPGQSVYITHMARTLHGTQAELDRNLPKPLKAAYDGLEVDFQA